MAGNTRFYGVDWRICVDETTNGMASGFVYSRCIKKPMPFQGLGALILLLDEIMDARNFPQAFQKMRIFEGSSRTESKSGGKQATEYVAGSTDEEMKPDSISDMMGKIATFSIHVVSRRNASWQGQLDFMDGGAVPFSSTLEMLHAVNNQFDFD